MSVSVSAVPFLLIYTVSRGVIEFIKLSNDAKNSIRNYDNGEFHIDNELAEKLYDKEFQTTIMDKDILLKTLKEHGAVNIVENNEDISCSCESFNLNFYKNQDEPYTLKITYNEEYNLQELVGDISTEYATNAQEVSYNKIKERLEAQNLTIDNEEITDDDTIILTVNLE